MKNSIKTRWSRALAAVIFSCTLVTMVTACSGPYTTGPCNCLCTCTNGNNGFCRDKNDNPGTPGCQANCRAQSTELVICNDSTTTSLPPPQGPDPVCPSGDTYATYAFCEKCTGPVPFERQIDASGCTQDDAEAQADKYTAGDNGDEGDSCDVELCKGSDPGFVIHID